MTSSSGPALDLDSHLQLGPEQLSAAFGRAAAALPDPHVTPGNTVDGDTVWSRKGSSAPGAADPAARVAVLDAMGIERQLVLPRVRVARACWRPGEAGIELTRQYNDFATRWAAGHGDRLRIAAVAWMDDPGTAADLAVRAIEAGARAMLVSCGTPPAGASPADESWSPFWQLLADHGVPAIIHAGSEAGFVPRAWAPKDLVFTDPACRSKVDIETVDLFQLLTAHYGPMLFLTSLIMGAVFERFPGLRVAVTELGASWIPAWARLLDERASTFGDSVGQFLSQRPSQYIRANVRATPYHWENIRQLLDGDDELAGIYCFSTDFPHSEGGSASIEMISHSLAGLPGEKIASYLYDSAAAII